MGVSPADKLKFSTASELELIQQCLRGSNVVLPAATLQYLFDALRDLFTQADPHELNQNLALARSITSQLALIVGTGAEVPPSTFEKLVAAREMLQAGVQETRGLPADERSTPAGRGDGSSDVAAGNGALLPDGAQRYTDAGDEAQQLRFVVEKMAAGATQFKVNKLHQLLAALVKESVVLPALTATKKALDPTLRGYIEVSAFLEWWPRSKFADESCQNEWLKQLNAEALRAKLVTETLQKEVVQRAAAAAAAEAGAERRRALAQQPKRGLALLARLRKTENRLQEAHGCLLREALAYVEELQDFSPGFVELLNSELLAASPLMHPGSQGLFPQILAHKEHVAELRTKLVRAQEAERATLQKGALRLTTMQAQLAPAHARMHERSANQCASWLRNGIRVAGEGSGSGEGKEAQLQRKQFADHECLRLKAAMTAQLRWLESEHQTRMEHLPTRFRKLAWRTLLRWAANEERVLREGRMGGLRQQRRAYANMLSTDLSYELDSEQQAELASMQARLGALAREIGPMRGGAPIDEHIALLHGDIALQQAAQLGHMHHVEHRCVPLFLATFGETFSARSEAMNDEFMDDEVSDEARASSRTELLAALGIKQADLFVQMITDQTALQRAARRVHEYAEQLQRSVNAFSALSGGANGRGALTTEGRQVFQQLWQHVTALSAEAQGLQAAVSTAVEGLGQYLRDYARKELPRQAAMHATAKELADTGGRLLQIVRGEDNAQAQAAAAEAPNASDGSEVAVIGQGWTQACVGMQAQHQALLASLADIEQHALDMQQLMLKDAGSVTHCMRSFVSLSERKPNQPAGGSRPDAAPTAKELQQQCAAFRFAVDTLLMQAQERLPRAELQVQLDGLQQQQCDALRSWCTPLFRQAREVLDRALGNPRELKAAENKIFAPFVSAATESGVKVGGADVIFGGTNQGPGVLSLEAQSVAQDKGAENVVQELIDSKEAREADRVLPPTLQKRRDTLQQTVTTRQGSFLQAYGALRAIDYFLELAVLSGTAGLTKTAMAERLAQIAKRVNAQAKSTALHAPASAGNPPAKGADGPPAAARKAPPGEKVPVRAPKGATLSAVAVKGMKRGVGRKKAPVASAAQAEAVTKLQAVARRRQSVAAQKDVRRASVCLQKFVRSRQAKAGKLAQAADKQRRRSPLKQPKGPLKGAPKRPAAKVGSPEPAKKGTDGAKPTGVGATLQEARQLGLGKPGATATPPSKPAAAAPRPTSGHAKPGAAKAAGTSKPGSKPGKK